MSHQRRQARSRRPRKAKNSAYSTKNATRAQVSFRFVLEPTRAADGGFVHGGAANTMAWRRGGGNQSRMSAPIHVTPSCVSSPAACLLSMQKHSNPAFAHGRTMFPARSHKLRTEPLLAFRSATVLRAQSGMSPLPILRETVSRLTPKARASGAFQRASNMTGPKGRTGRIQKA